MLETDALGRHIETDTYTCGHCGRVHEVGRGHPDYDFCRSCMKVICPHCLGKGCQPLEQRIERYEAQQRMFRDLGFLDG